jgi:hypothetical protein
MLWWRPGLDDRTLDSVIESQYASGIETGPLTSAWQIRI